MRQLLIYVDSIILIDHDEYEWDLRTFHYYKMESIEYGVSYQFAGICILK